MTDVHLKYIDDVKVKIVADASTVMELSDHFTFYAPNYKFSPKYKARVWDGKIRLINNLSATCYTGLAKKIKKFCDSHEYSFSFDPEFYYSNVSEYELKQFIISLNLPEKYQLRDYQFDSILKCARSNRRTLLSPTASGKSLIIYILIRWYEKHKGLIIVPTIGLVQQMSEDFYNYGYKGKIHLSTEKLSRDNDIPADLVITTWQSLNNGKNKMQEDWYEQFGVVFGDEAHGAKATSMIQIISSMKNCKYRFGTTGTLDGDLLNENTIEGLFGPIYKSISTKELMDQGFVSTLKIKCIVLKYPEEVVKGLKKLKYHEEVDFITNYAPRNEFIKNLVLSLDGNKLLFFKLIDHGKELYRLLSDKPNNNVFHIDGDVSSTEREKIRVAMEEEKNAILIASMGTTSTGVNINKLHHMISANPSKSKIRVLQSIGRMLRLHKEKNGAILYDIVDDLSYKSHRNHTLEHYIERCKIYDKEGFEYKIYNTRIK